MAAVHVGLALAMGIPGAARFLIAAIIATAALVAASPASAAPYPVSYDFSQGVLAQAAHPDSPPAGANDWSCRPSQAHPRPVVSSCRCSARRRTPGRPGSPADTNEV